ncbi:lipocalin family protein [Mucilaginibacter sp. AW1-3]
MKKRGFLILLIPILSGLFFIAACKKSSSGDQPDPATVALIVGSPGKLWQLNSGTYTIPLSICNCAKKHNHLMFNADGIFAQSAYTCNAPIDSADFYSANNASGKWTLASDNVSLNLGGAKYNLVSVTANTLVLDVLNSSGVKYERLNYISVDSAPFLPFQDRAQQLCNVTWKFKKIILNGFINQTVDPDLRLKYNTNGIMVTSSIDPRTLGYPYTDNWTLFQDQSTAGIRLFTTGTSTGPTLDMSIQIVELIGGSFIYSYFDTRTGTTTVSYMVPQ